MEIAVVARGMLHLRPDVGFGTSSHAEWLALLHALEIARLFDEPDIRLVGDARDVVDQAGGRMRCRDALGRDLLATFRERAAGFTRVRIAHVRRGQNLAGIALARTHVR